MSSPLRPATDITTVFGRTLGAVRALAGYSQTELAALIPVDRSAIARFEIGRTTTSVPMLVAIERPLLAARALRLPSAAPLSPLAHQANHAACERCSVVRDGQP